jgi:hypothetical protein
MGWAKMQIVNVVALYEGRKVLTGSNKTKLTGCPAGAQRCRWRSG